MATRKKAVIKKAVGIKQPITPAPINPLDEQVGGDHYKKYSIQPVEFTVLNGIGFLEGCVVKRMARHQDKNGVQDLIKAKHEIDLLAKLKYGVEL